MKDEEKVCLVKVLRLTWKVLKKSKGLEEAKIKFKDLVLKVVLEEDVDS